MLGLLVAAASWLSVGVQADTLVVRTAAAVPMLDGRVSEREYGTPAARIATPAGDVRVWLAHHDGFLYVAAAMPDSSFYWGDDFVVSLSPSGRASPGLDVGDRQWYLRRTLDSSVVSLVGAGFAGRWSAPGREPPPLGTMRRDADWEVAGTSSADGWSIELRIRDRVLGADSASLPRIAFRTYNDAPQGWWSWPTPPAGMRPQQVERTPSMWLPIKLR
jgi:hypothetical protein